MDDATDERADALDRFERTLDAQLALLNEIDEKASNVVRYTSLLVGAIFTALSLVPRSGVASFGTIGPVSHISFLVGTTALVVAICTAIITYLSSVQEYGLDASYGYIVADGAVRTPNYERAMLTGYADAVRRNTAKIEVNARRFGWSVASLFTGVVYCSLAGALVVLDAPTWVDLLMSGVVTSVDLTVVYMIYSEAFLVIGRE